MELVQKIYEHPLYQRCLAENKEAEKERIFCGHDLQHFLDTARLSYIFALERGYHISKEEIYAAALLHDIGRWKQYKGELSHEEAGTRIAEEILTDIGWEEQSRNRILDAIREHRTVSEDTSDTEKLREVLYDGDKRSRACYLCPAEKECNWSIEKKNMQVIW